MIVISIITANISCLLSSQLYMLDDFGKRL